MSKSFYITTTLPYVNAEPHIGFALEIVQADVLARWKRELGYDVFFNTGTDEHGQKIYLKALNNGQSPKEYVDHFAGRFGKLKDALNLSYNNFIRTTDEHHKKAAQKLWMLCKENGFIEKGTYEVKYCVGCELEKTDSELEDGKCPLHPTYDIEIRKEENYFFKFSKLQDALLEIYETRKDFVVPEYRLLEVKKFVESGLRDFSISRLRSKMPWGVPVPDDPDHVMYVWFDALTNYISALGWPDNDDWLRYWGDRGSEMAVQVAGKDNLRQQSAIWQAILIAGGLPTTGQIMIHGFITADGQKMSKSLGNVVNPFEYVERYGTDPLRYFLLSKIHPFNDSDFTKDRFESAYNDDLANGLGNLVARFESMAVKNSFEYGDMKPELSDEISSLLSEYRFDKAMEFIWKMIKDANVFINENAIWKMSRDDAVRHLGVVYEKLWQISKDLSLFMPDTADEIMNRLSGTPRKSQPLFPRLR